MTDIEISNALALAIGWKPKSIDTHGTDSLWCYTGYKWHRFDYRDWSVIGPIAEKYNCFPYGYQTLRPEWECIVDDVPYYADTPQKAIAMAVIGGVK